MKIAYKLLTIYTFIFLLLMGSHVFMDYPPLNATYILIGLIPFAIYFLLKLNQHNRLGKTSTKAAQSVQNSWIFLLADPTRWWVSRNWLTKLSLLTIALLFFGLIGAATYAILDYRQSTSLQDLKVSLDQTNQSLSELKAQTGQIEHLHTTTQTMSDQLLALEETLGIGPTQDGDVVTPVLGSSDSDEATARLNAINQQIDQTLSSIDFKNTPNSPPSTNPTSVPNQKTISVADSQTSQVNVYSQPNTNSNIIGKLEKNQPYPYTSRMDTWYRVSLNSNVSGWVPGHLVEEN